MGPWNPARAPRRCLGERASSAPHRRRVAGTGGAVPGGVRPRDACSAERRRGTASGRRRSDARLARTGAAPIRRVGRAPRAGEGGARARRGVRRRRDRHPARDRRRTIGHRGVRRRDPRPPRRRSCPVRRRTVRRGVRRVDVLGPAVRDGVGARGSADVAHRSGFVRVADRGDRHRTPCRGVGGRAE